MHADELARVDIDEDAEHARLAACAQRLGRPARGDDERVVGFELPAGIGLHGAEQNEVLADIVRCHRDARVRQRHDQPLGMRRRRGERECERDGKARDHFGLTTRNE